MYSFKPVQNASLIKCCCWWMSWALHHDTWNFRLSALQSLSFRLDLELTISVYELLLGVEKKKRKKSKREIRWSLNKQLYYECNRVYRGGWGPKCRIGQREWVHRPSDWVNSVKEGEYDATQSKSQRHEKKVDIRKERSHTRNKTKEGTLVHGKLIREKKNGQNQQGTGQVTKWKIQEMAARKHMKKIQLAEQVRSKH